MKSFSLLAVLLFSVQSFAQTKMGRDAVEMFNVLSHPRIQECLINEHLDLVNVEITKSSAPCIGCNHYEIAGHKKYMDIASGEKTIIMIKGKAVPGTFRTWVQTYTCEIINN